MSTPFFLIPLAAVFQTVAPQSEPEPTGSDRKVRIEIVTTENGETKRVTHEFDATNEEQMQDALRDLGVLEHMRLGDGEHDMTIDIRGFGEDGEDLFLHMAPMPPDAPEAPAAPTPFFERGAYLGVSTQTVSDEARAKNKSAGKGGAYVNEVVDDTPAAKLGLQPGDIITALDGSPVEGPRDLSERIRSHEAGDDLKVTWYRNGKKMSGSVELAERNEMSYAYSDDTPHGGEAWDWEGYLGDGGEGTPRAFLGVTPGDGEADEPGALIGSVEDGSAAMRMGISAGDVILSVNGTETSDFDALSRTIRGMEPGAQVKVELLRGAERMTVSGDLGERKDDVIVRIPGMPGSSMEGLPPGEREELRREMDELREEMNELRREMGREMRREVRINIESRPLSDEEKALLSSKGVDGLDKTLDLGNLRAFPNPSNGFYRLQFELPQRGDLNVDVLDAKGDRVYQERIIGFKGRYERTLDLTDQATGNYFLIITQGGRTATSKLVKE